MDNLPYWETTGPSFTNHGLLTVTAAFNKKLAIYIRKLMKENERTFETPYLISPSAYSFRNPEYHTSKSRTNYDFQKLLHIIPHTLNTYPFLTELSLQNMSYASVKKLFINCSARGSMFLTST